MVRKKILMESLYYKQEIEKILKILHTNWINPEEREALVKILNTIWDRGYTLGWMEGLYSGYEQN